VNLFGDEQAQRLDAASGERLGDQAS